MKQLIKFSLLAALLLVIWLFRACSGSTLFFTYGYSIHHGTVYYKQPFPQPVLKMERADAASFQVISRKDDSGYADNRYFGIDKKRVYYCGYPIEGSDGPTFQLMHVNYAKDKNQCYYRGQVIPGADPVSFQIRDDDFSGDKNHLFRRTVLIDNDTTIFQRFDSSQVIRTANFVSVYDALIPIPPGATFRHCGYNYFSLDDNIYFYDKLLPSGGFKNFKAINNFFSKTDRHVYYRDQIIEDANPATYRMLADPYASDGQHIFFFEKKIEGADVKSFEIINEKFQCARDKRAVYHEDKDITTFSASDLINKNTCTNCTDSAIYFAQ